MALTPEQMFDTFWSLVGQPAIELPPELSLPIPATEAELWDLMTGRAPSHEYVPEGAL